MSSVVPEELNTESTKNHTGKRGNVGGCDHTQSAVGPSFSSCGLQSASGCFFTLKMTLKGSRQLLGLARASTAGVGLAAEQLGRQTPAQPAQLLPAAQRLLFTGSGEQGQQPGAKAGPWAAAAAGVAAALGLATFASSNSSSMPWAPRTALAEAKPKSPAAGAATAPAKKALPVYSAEEVSKHKTKEQRIWVTFKDGVYDITEFIAMHPGGAQRIMLAAGGGWVHGMGGWVGRAWAKRPKESGGMCSVRSRPPSQASSTAAAREHR